MTIPLQTMASRVLSTGPMTFERSISRLERMIADPGCSPPLVATIISCDPMLTALILSRANAALPEGRDPVVSVPSAVGLLGLSSVLGLLAEVSRIPPQQSHLVASHWALGKQPEQWQKPLPGYCRVAQSG